MKKHLSLVLVVAAFLVGGAAVAQPPSAGGLWTRADRLAESSRRDEASARLDIGRGQVDAALMRYRGVVRAIAEEIDVLETLCGHERNLDRQQAARVRLAAARDHLERAEDIVNLLRTSANRRD
ncbi:MAG: hypothetical protein H6744_07205 [Deltaproteobacteria bacterium]|nr:hypothetical protein [Deltaproteobacteria bacterium]MCB9786466.1 hypothetical protein [Deltaproteobacteria bacterium]